MKPLVIYHGNCPDGTGAAAAAYLKFGEEADYLAAKYGDPEPMLSGVIDRVIYLLDFSYPRKTIEWMAKFAKSLTIIDHHETAEKDLLGLQRSNLSMNFDQSHSGAYLTWQYFHSHPHSKIPEMILYIEDRDLWKWRMDRSKEISAALHAAYGFDFREWAWAIEHWGYIKDGLVLDGCAILSCRDEFVEVMLKTTEDVILGGYVVRAANATVLFSEVPTAILDRFPDSPFGIGWFWDGARQCYQVSLRSKGDFNVSRIAKEYGGGGHKNSAGFVCKELPWKKIIKTEG